MRRTALLIAALVAAPAQGQEVTDILSRHAEARGGPVAIEAIQSIEVRVTIDEGWVVEGHYRATRAGEMRIDVYAGEARVFTEALQEGAAWAMQQDESVGSPITEEEARILWRGVLGNVYGLHELEHQGVAVNVDPPESAGGDWIVDLVHQDGFEDRLYLDPESFLVVRKRSDHALHPAVDPEVKRFETRYSDFRQVEGVWFPFVSEKFDLDSGERVQKTTTQSIGINTVEDMDQFQMPQ